MTKDEARIVRDAAINAAKEAHAATVDAADIGLNFAMSALKAAHAKAHRDAEKTYQDTIGTAWNIFCNAIREEQP